MKVGSLVTLRQELPPVDSWAVSLVKWQPVMQQILTIREVTYCEASCTDLLLFEEGVIGFNDWGQELGSPTKFYRELLPPEAIDIEALLEETTPQLQTV